MNILHYLSGTSSAKPAGASRPKIGLASATRMAALGLLALAITARGDEFDDFCGDLCPTVIIQSQRINQFNFNLSFGGSVAGLSSNTFAVGILSDVGNRVHIYRTDGTLIATVLDPNPASRNLEIFGGDMFGRALASFANGRYLVGAAHENFAGSGIQPRNIVSTTITNAGKVYLYSANYSANSTDNVPLLTLVNPSGPINNAEFGWSVASLEPNGILVGAPGVTVGTNKNAGIAYFFNTSGGLLSTITNPVPRADNRFGATVSRLGANKFLVAAPRAFSIPGQAGRVYLYGTNGVLLATIQNPSIRRGTVNVGFGGFGETVKEIGGGRFIVGAPANDFVTPAATNAFAGMVYLYDNNGLLLKAINNPFLNFGFFGSVLTALGTDRFAVSALGRPRVYIYSLDGDLLTTLDEVDTKGRYFFGESLGAVGDYGLLIGGSVEDYGGGRVYVYDTRLPEFILGQEIPRPPELALVDVAAIGPKIDPPDAAYWHRRGAFDARLYATRPGKIRIDWTSSFAVQGLNVWPTNALAYQTNIANCPPVDLTDGGRYPWTELKYTDLSSGTETDSVRLKHQFQATGPGKSLLMLSAGPPSENPIYFQPINTLEWNMAVHSPANVPAVIGTEITNHFGYHNPASGGPFVYWPNSRYWADTNYYDRAARTGPIIPVNVDLPTTETDDMLLVYYQKGRPLTNAASGIPVTTSIDWPWKPVRYTNAWPTVNLNDNFGTNVIANICGKEIINRAKYVDWDIYVQNDPSKPGFNPNDEHALREPWGSGEAIFPLRDDLGTNTTSLPYVLMTYRDPTNGLRGRMKVFRVVATNSTYSLTAFIKAGTLLQAPYPLTLFQTASLPASPPGPWWQDRKDNYWARSAGVIVMRYRYPAQPTFYFPAHYPPPPSGGTVPWLDLRAGTLHTPINVQYTVYWPDQPPTIAQATLNISCDLSTEIVPELRVGETLVKPKFGLPDVRSQSSVDVLYQQAAAQGLSSVRLIDPTLERQVPLTNLPPDVKVENESGLLFFPQLPPHLRSRIFLDPLNNKLKIRGQFVEPVTGEYYLLLNLITAREKTTLLSLTQDNTAASLEFKNAVNLLPTTVIEVPAQTANPYDSLALTAGYATGVGYVVLAFANNTNFSAQSEPISLAVIKVACPLYQGEIKTVESENAFEEKLTLRHSGDFAGRADQFTFQWLYHSPVNGAAPAPPGLNPNTEAANLGTWLPFVLPAGLTNGAVDITIEGPGLQTLKDQYFICRYRPMNTPLCTGPVWSVFTTPKLAEGWIKRVLKAIGPFEQRIKQYRNNQVNTLVSMISQAGPRYVGPIALNSKAANSFGLIEIYQTILDRGRALSIEAGFQDPEANQALQLAAGRIADLYMLLGNEAYADAADPTIAFGTDDRQYGSEASSIHCFMNQTPSLLEEELALLRGRDAFPQPTPLPGVERPPIYNHLIWNFTRDINGGAVAYALNYNIRNHDGDVAGTINEADAKVLYPQGHGDAWGHYLTAIKTYYYLLQHSSYTWLPQSEAVEVGGADVAVDYLDERKFAAAAAAKAKTGAEIVNLTYRQTYVENPAAQWKAYLDSVQHPKSSKLSTSAPRAWGVYDWASRAGQGAYFDWVMGNALLPATNTTGTGIQKIDRTTVTELREVSAAFQDIQAKSDMADLGLNPLGLAKGALPFDLDPAQVAQGKTHFEQIYERSVGAMNNAIAVFNHANNSTQLLRRQADTVDDFQINVEDREIDFNSRLIEVFGYPYSNDIGPAGTYPSGYHGPDLYHADYFDPSELLGLNPPPIQELVLALNEIEVDEVGALTKQVHNVTFHISRNGLGLIKPPAWTGTRRAPGEIQFARSDVLQTKARFEKALKEYDNLLSQIEGQASLLEAQYNLNADSIGVWDDQLGTVQSLNALIRQSRGRQMGFTRNARLASLVADAIAEAFPQSVGVSSDVTSIIRGVSKMLGTVITEVQTRKAEDEALVELDSQNAKELAQLSSSIHLQTLQQGLPVLQQITQLEGLVRSEAPLRLEIYTLKETIQQSAGRYLSALAKGQRLLEDRLRFRQQTAAKVQGFRHKDMAFRIFRNDALQKYRAQFDLAAMYVYLAAQAYDYETSLLPGDARGPGQNFLTDIVRSRSLGIIQGGLPQTGAGRGDPGLADPLARMYLNWSLVLKGQLGFNNPKTETGRFSLRSELFRTQTNTTSVAANAVWREVLTRGVVPDLLAMPEFQRYCIPFYPHNTNEPAIVIPFETTINFGQNFFGKAAGGGDNDYDSTHFATKIRSVGVWFANYNNLGGGMVNTPRVYLIPIGNDIMRSPTGRTGAIRTWTVLDQALPVPFPSDNFVFDPDWIPMNDTLFGEFGAIRKYARFRAYHDSGNFNEAETISDNRLVCRSVWNTRWLLIIPGGTLHSDRNEGIQRFINGPLVNGQRTGNGVSDIKLFFQTYAYSGN